METRVKLVLIVLESFLLVTANSQEEQSDEGQAEVGSNYGPSERTALDKFRPMVQGMLYRDYMRADEYLMPFLRAQHFNLHEAREMLGKAHRWRRENNMDNILGEDVRQLEKHFPYYLDGLDVEGRPVISWNLGKWDIRRIALAGRMDLLKRYTDRILEEGATKVRHQREITKKPVTQMQIVIDGNGYSLRQHACISCLPFYYNFIKINDQYYPQASKHIYMINVPRIFESLHALLRPIMSESTRDAIKVFGHNKNDWIREFSQNIPLDQLRRSFGGTKIA